MLTATVQRLNGATAHVYPSSHGGFQGSARITTDGGGELVIIDAPDMAEAIAAAINGVLDRRRIEAIAAAEASECEPARVVVRDLMGAQS